MKLIPINIEINGRPYVVYSNLVMFEELVDLIKLKVDPSARSYLAKTPINVDNGDAFQIYIGPYTPIPFIHYA